MLIDRSGVLVRVVTGVLVLLTMLACGRAWAISRAAPAAGPSTQPTPKLHIGLLIISLFFCVGLLVTEALLHEKRQTAAAETATADNPAPATPAAAVTPVPAPAAPAPTAQPQPPAASVEAAPVMAAPAPVPAIAVAAPATTPVAPMPAPPKTDAAKPAATTKNTPAPAAKTSPSTASETARPAAAKPRSERPALPARCSDIAAQFSTGRTVSDADKQFLETSCR